MTQNPFEAPRVSSHQPSAQSAGGTGQFDLGQSVSEAWEATKSNLGLLIAGSIVAGIAITIAFVTVIGIFLVVPVLAWGLVRLYLNVFDGEGEFGDIFAGFSNFGPALGSMLILMGAIFMLGMPGQILNIAGAAAEMPILSVLSGLVGLVIGFGVTIRLYFAPWFIVDQGMSGVDALKASWEVTSDKKLLVIGFSIVAGLIAMVGVLACGFGLLITGPISYMMYASAYRQMVGGGR